MSDIEKLNSLISNIDTVEGHCEECEEHTILIAIVKDYYRCTNCGADTLQYINGRIRYLQLSDLDKKKLLEMRNG